MNKHIATLTDGTIAKRNSKTRVYAFAIEVAETAAARRTWCATGIATMEKFAAEGTWSLADTEDRIATYRSILASLEGVPDDELVCFGVWGWSGDARNAERARIAAAKVYQHTALVPAVLL